jgi:beta-N-acetylhexosaminidase
MDDKDINSKIGQIFMVGLPGVEVDDSTRDLIKNYRINNFIIFKRNVVNPEQLRNLTGNLADLCRKQGLALPLIAIDQEGGTVARLDAPFFTEFADAREYAQSPDPDKKLGDYAATCGRELRQVGINLNFAPVLDICPGQQDFFMERRSLGKDAGQVARHGALIIKIMQEQGVAACAKHFPGLGGAKLDPHLLLPVVQRSRLELEDDLIPFQEAVMAGVAAIMTSHTVYPHLDPDIPATLSAVILTEILRRKMDFQGVVVTDDLEMGAIENEMAIADAALASFQAGADLLLICHDHEKVKRTWNKLATACTQGLVSADRLKMSLARIAELGRRYGV